MDGETFSSTNTTRLGEQPSLGQFYSSEEVHLTSPNKGRRQNTAEEMASADPLEFSSQDCPEQALHQPDRADQDRDQAQKGTKPGHALAKTFDARDDHLQAKQHPEETQTCVHCGSPN
jgi:hypothetical protein